MDPIRTQTGSALILALVLCWVGRLMVQRRQDLHAWGLRIAALSFVAYCMVIGIDEHADTTGEWSGVAIRGIFAAGIALGTAWILLPVLAFLFHYLVRSPVRAIGKFFTAIRHGQEAARKRREDEELAERARQASEVEQARWIAEAPERERQRLLAVEQQRQQELQRHAAQKRRDDARASALLSYTYYAAKLGDRFSRDDFDLYVSTYMDDGKPAEVVEQRAKELIAILERHLGDVQPRKPRSLEEATNWFTDQKRRIESLDIDGVTKQTLLANLSMKFQEILDSTVAEMRP